MLDGVCRFWCRRNKTLKTLILCIAKPLCHEPRTYLAIHSLLLQHYPTSSPSPPSQSHFGNFKCSTGALAFILNLLSFHKSFRMRCAFVCVCACACVNHQTLRLSSAAAQAQNNRNKCWILFSFKCGVLSGRYDIYDNFTDRKNQK